MYTLRECKNEIDLGKFVQTVTIHLGALRLRAASRQAKVQMANGTHPDHNIHNC